MPEATALKSTAYDPIVALRKIGSGDTPSDLERSLKEAIDYQTDLTVKQMELRDEARADVLTIISRARVRAGGSPTNWSPKDASAAFDVLSLVLACQGTPAPAADPVFDRLTEVEDRVAAVRRLHAERALARRGPPDRATERPAEAP